MNVSLRTACVAALAALTVSLAGPAGAADVASLRAEGRAAFDSLYRQTPWAQDGGDLRTQGRAALDSLYRQTPWARELASKAKAVLIFPAVFKAGFIGGIQYGEGALITGGRWAGCYNTIQGSVGFQAGAQKFSYALFLMSGSAFEHLKRSDGWELGVGPEVVVLNVGGAAPISTITGRENVYAFVFDPRGLMAGVSLQGTKISRIAK